MENDKQFDLTPSPRVLRMLGQVDFKPWQCLAELADNAVDAFLTGREQGGIGVMFPQVNIEIPSSADISADMGTIRITDNAPGMDPELLERAVRAGFSGNNSVDKLGLFGMGFNVATARLGNRTEVWTTRADDEDWWGVGIDFDEMEKSDTFRVPALTRPKVPSETGKHGTEIVISKLDKERAKYLRSPGGLRLTRNQLSRVYNKIMREISLKVTVAGQELKAREFCVWDKKRWVNAGSRFGRVPAVIPIEVDLGERQYCNDCWVWLISQDTECPSCGSEDQLRMRARKVSGWIGIQRFFDQKDYGIDLIRNGRVIENRSKVFFSWTNPDDGDVLEEYPIEQQHWGGRIVGELNIDFVPLASHQKDSFDRNTAEWQMVFEEVHGLGPILPQIRQRLNFPDTNESPLARLHAAYRRGNPAGLRWLVPGNPKGINAEPQQWAARFWEGDPDYQSDNIWWEAVLQAEEAKQSNTIPVPPKQQGGDLFPGSDDDSIEPEGDKEGESTEPQDSPELQEEKDVFLSRDVSIPEMPGFSTLEVTTSRLVTGSLRSKLHMEFAPVGNRVEVLYDPRHTLFTSTLTEPVDCLVEELAFQLLQRSNTNQREWPISKITQLLREKYFSWSNRSYASIREQCASLVDELIQHFVEELSGLSPLDDSVVTEAELLVISRNVARKDRGGKERVLEVIRSGTYPRYLGNDGVIRLISSNPHLALDDKFFAVSYRDVDEPNREQIMDQLLVPLRDIVWAASFEPGDGTSEENRTMLARAEAGCRLLQLWRT
ncbi:MAG: ATP-binding protein [Caldilineaceae bacterium SB0661_bin_32]|uniref:ATP-binding protein n=1 Tax=Caldilineaceae bacterium SB0661_bin_32 TaxID=2605255 RepID=A0A6B1DBT7_9CHLR|nr:ATP-binding protein [Caldilineaceae bacterium SB0661_bin_32]